MDDFQVKIIRRFRRQQEFAAGYSPLYACLFGILADWLQAEPGNDPPADWLLQSSAGRSSFDVPLLLLAGLHREILTRPASVADLARYFPTAGGRLLPSEGDLRTAVHRALVSCRTELEAFIRSATVQTNEAARGLCWLLPLSYTGWASAHLVDLGASAGLNLIADCRRYCLTALQDEARLLDLGCGKPGEQFVVACEGAFTPPMAKLTPRILSRIGCDLKPVSLATARDEHMLAAFVWGDQTDRMARLRQSIAALHQVNREAVPVHLYQADLPDELSRFLAKRITPLSLDPVVLYNTYLTTYLHDKGVSLQPQIACWASRLQQPVLHLQWETLWDGQEPPAFGWVAWTADLWQNGRHHHWHLAWVHPHGTHIRWLPGMEQWATFWQNHYVA